MTRYALVASVIMIGLLAGSCSIVKGVFHGGGDDATIYSVPVDPTAGGLIGQSVFGPDGTKLGDISDLVIRKYDKVSYAVIRVARADGRGARAIVIPYQDLKVGPHAITLASTMTPDDIRAMPDYQPDVYMSIIGRHKG